MAVERVLSNLNLISFKTEDGLQNHIDELQDGDLVFTPDNSLKGNLFDFKWTDHKLNDISWLNADTFSWQSGDVYVAAYEHLLNDWNTYWEGKDQNDGSNWSHDVVEGIDVGYIVAPDGHKICYANQEEDLQALFEKTGVAWYYLIDQPNKQFKLPRTKFGFTGLRDEVGKYVEAGLPNITGTLSIAGDAGITIGGNSGAFTLGNATLSSGPATNTQSGAKRNAAFDASLSSSVYGNSNTVQPKATQMYLYFYVGNFERDALEQTAGITSEQLNNKADISDVQALETRTGTLEQGDYVVASQKPTSSNGYTWYRKYKSGWVEQGGRWSGTRDIAQGESGNVTPSLPIKMANKYYYVNAACEDIFCFLMNTNAEVHQCTFGWGAYTVGRTLSAFIWEVKGFAA